MLIGLFQKTQVKNLYILSAIILNQANTVESIAKNLDISTTTTKRSIAQLRDELSNLFPEEEILINEGNQIELAPSFHSRKFLPVIKLANEYLTVSSTAKLLKMVIEQPKLNIITLANELHISQSYCYTLINNLNAALKNYSIQLSTHDNQVFLDGEEIRLILLTYSFQKWQYELDDELLAAFYSRHSELNKEDNIDNAAMRLAIFKEALLTRGLPKMPSEHYDENLDQLHTIIQEGHDYFSDMPNPLTHEGEQLKRAVNSIGRLWITRINNPQTQLELAKQMIELDNPITDLAQDLASSFIYRFKVEAIQNDTDAFLLLFYQLTINIMYIYQFRIDFSKMFYPTAIDIFEDEKAVERTPEYKLIEQFVNYAPIKSPIWEVASSPLYRENFYRIFYATLDYSYTPKVNIYVDTSASIDGLYLFKQRLSSVFSNDIFTYTDDAKHADIVFIDRAKTINTTGEIYLLYNVTTTEKWQDVFKFILSIYFDKITRHTENAIDDYFIK
ncbi:hypothetical protein G7081_00105 [Vagococcus coleopterorum]|uniref:Mga helix-turn-helix domain-containing protein n=1 Tax=Vagococcus coleopterorum TaxID=2714946 RepID=A0A6G8AKV8_9ENTE|nr:helix-turn-helix domain-containing protein [Vagococcus coleopterorum]QIL45599.1 hypothetical protein G7081_00105 [Vagococcus coleopterorum]